MYVIVCAPLPIPQLTHIYTRNSKLRYNDPGEFCKGMGGSYPIYA